MKENVNKLYASMQALDGKINEARTKKDQFIARAKTAKTSQQVNEMISGVGDSSALEAFERMKVKVEELETRADVAAEMTIGGSADVSLESKFKALEGSDVDQELAKMKARSTLSRRPGSSRRGPRTWPWRPSWTSSAGTLSKRRAGVWVGRGAGGEGDTGGRQRDREPGARLVPCVGRPRVERCPGTDASVAAWPRAWSMRGLWRSVAAPSCCIFCVAVCGARAAPCRRLTGAGVVLMTG
eukprot:TRINITY_DN508_c3_g1_i1.p1 TRINITY_DN508_c3_g1~~TRINITY_DN508_c3_g1_i1.p1  ORF type:complete len:279 (+),score=65.03 TRINITY_DN508_c3_g1_i1:116-838(+)